MTKVFISVPPCPHNLCNNLVHITTYRRQGDTPLYNHCDFYYSIFIYTERWAVNE